MQPDVAGCEVTRFPSTISARTEDAPQVQVVGSRLAPTAVAALSVSTATSAMSKQAITRSRRPQSLTKQGWRWRTASAIGRTAHLQSREVLSLSPSRAIAGTDRSPGGGRRLEDRSRKTTLSCFRERNVTGRRHGNLKWW